MIKVNWTSNFISSTSMFADYLYLKLQWRQDRLFQKLLGVRYVNLTARALTEGGFESLFILIFETDPSEKLEKTSACYLSTSTGPVTGSLYLSICSSGFLQWSSTMLYCPFRPGGMELLQGKNIWRHKFLLLHLIVIFIMDLHWIAKKCKGRKNLTKTGTCRNKSRS
jgi:hypothetical protein